MTDERLATIEAQYIEIQRMLGRLEGKLDVLQEERLKTAVSIEKLKGQVGLLAKALGVLVLGGGGAGAILQLFQ